MNNNIKITREWAMPNKNTFDIKPIKEMLEEEMFEGLWIDPFANKNKLANITNDLNPEYDTDYHLDALDFLKMFDDNSVDGILYDPPFSPRQVSECYKDVGYNVTWDTTKASFWSMHKKEISRILKPGGKVITFGWNSGGIGMKYGFEISRILMVPHGGWHNDTICTVENKIKVEEDKMINKPNINYTDIDKKIIEEFEKLPSSFWDFKDIDTSELVHGIHTYPAMMVYPISRNILNIVEKYKKIDALMDPFVGSGTVLVEAMLSNIKNIYGNDLNPLARLLSKVKTTILNKEVLIEEKNKLIEDIEKKYNTYGIFIKNINLWMEKELDLDLSAKDGWGSSAPEYMKKYYLDNNIDLIVPNFSNIGFWFKPNVIVELEIIKESIEKIDDADIKDFILVAFSETIRLVSNKRNGEFKMYRMRPEKVKTFEPDVKKEFFRILNRNVEKELEFSNKVANHESKVFISDNDAKELNDIPNNSIDIVITSPPYGDSKTTVAYGEFSRLSLQWLGLYGIDEEKIKSIDKSLMGGAKYKKGFDNNIKSITLKNSLNKISKVDMERAGDVYSFYLDLEKIIETVSKKVKNDSYQFWVVGNRTVKNENLKTDVIIREIAENYGLKYLGTIDRNILNKVMPSKNSPTNKSGEKVTTMVNEHIVILKK